MLKQVMRFFSAFVSLAVLNVAVAVAVPITGKVVGPDDKPVARARVFVFKGINEFPPTSSLILETDQAGVFKTDLNPTTAPGNPPGSYGIATAYVPGFAISGMALKPGDNIIKLLPASSMRGAVKDGAGKIVAGARVKIIAVIKSETAMDGLIAFVPEQLQDKFSAQTGDDGQWVISDVPAAFKAAVLLQDPHYAQTFQIADTGTGKEVAATLIANPGANVAGKIVFEDGKPAPGIKVSAGATGANPFGATAVTDATGAYLLTGLAPGAAAVNATDPSGQWVATPVTDIKTTAGETAQAPNSVLTAGAFVTGTVTDKASGVPLADVSLMANTTGQLSGRPSVEAVHSDKAGHYKLRVVPGKSTLSVFEYPKGYLPLTQPLQVEVGKGETKDLPVQLSKGLSVMGTALDAGGKPVAQVAIKASLHQQTNGEWVQPVETVTDATGKWTLEGLRPGQWDLTSSGAWDITTPQSLTLPATGATQITVHKLNLLALKGRVVTSAHRPVTGVLIKAQIQIPEGPNSTRADQQEATTDADGRFTLTNLRPNSTVSLSSHIAGYKFLSGGKVTTGAQNFEAQDMILEPLTAKVTGQVVDAAGKPVAGAQIISPDGDRKATATSDAKGQFILTSLPATDVYVIAGYKGAVGEARDVNSKAPVTITLKPESPIAPNNTQRAYELLEDMWATTEGGQNYRSSIPVAMAPYDPDLAVKLCAKKDGTVDSQTLSGIIVALARVNPAQAAEWAPSRLPQIQEPYASYSAKVNLALAIAAIKPDLAKDLYNQAKTYNTAEVAKNPKENQGMAQRAIQLSRLASRLGLKSEADQFAATAVTAVQAVDKDQRQWMLGSLAGLNPDLAEKMLAELPSDQRKQALSSAVTSAARYDVAAARRAYDKLVATEKADPNGGGYSSYALKSLVEAMVKTDPAGALALARGDSTANNYYRPVILAMVAQSEPKEVALPLLREAGTVANGQYQAVAMTVQVASIAYDLDPALGTELFATAKTQMDVTQAATNDNDDIYNRGDRNVAEFAYFYSRLDPAISRLMIEAEFTRIKQQPADGNNVWQRNNMLSGLVAAMAAVDVDRALEMAWALPPADKDNQWSNPQTEAQLNIAQYLLLSDKDRHAKGFREWDRANGWD